jgi:mRNA-degrading endonuclease HigB of HigAB toxin-antitoxin module
MKPIISRFLLFPKWEQCYKFCMRVIARHVLLAYARAHAETAIPLERWYRLVKAANWTSMDDIRHAAPKSKVLNRDRVRFNIAGGNYSVDRRIRLPPANRVREVYRHTC